MVRVVTLKDLRQLIDQVGLESFCQQLMNYLTEDFNNWQSFEKSPRHATHFKHGVMELMPTCGAEYYAYKFVNGHPGNPGKNKLTVVATGMLAEIKTGYPLLVSEMTLLTAFRTAATSVLASRYLAKKSSQSLGIIGTGSQGEFQVLAHYFDLGIKTVKYFDIDSAAMQKFAANLAKFDLELIACNSAQETVQDVDIIITATADKNRLTILNHDWLQAGQHINGIGGDCPGKTELDAKILDQTKIVIEYLPQTQIEGEIQGLSEANIYAELWQLVQAVKPGRENDSELTLFDSVGFAIEDHAVLRLVYDLSTKLNIGESMSLVPELKDPKNLFSLVN